MAGVRIENTLTLNGAQFRAEAKGAAGAAQALAGAMQGVGQKSAAGLKGADAEAKKLQGSIGRLVKEIGGLDARNAAGVKALQLAIGRIGGAANLSEAQLERLRQKIAQLERAGAKLPASLARLKAPQSIVAPSGPTLGSKLEAGVGGALESQAQALAGNLGPAGGILAALGPGGLVAAADVGVLAVALSGAASGLASATSAAIAYGGAISDAAGRTGIGITSLQEFTFAAQQGGATMEDVEGAMRKAQEAITSGSSALKSLGLDFNALRGLSPEAQLRAIASAIGRIEDPARRTALAVKIFGETGAKLLPLVSSLDAASARARELGIVMGADTAAALDATGDSIAEVSAAWDGLSRNLGAAVGTTPGLAAAFSDLATAVGSVSGAVNDNRTVLQDLTSATIVPMISGVARLTRELGLAVQGFGMFSRDAQSFLRTSPALIGFLDSLSGGAASKFAAGAPRAPVVQGIAANPSGAAAEATRRALELEAKAKRDAEVAKAEAARALASQAQLTGAAASKELESLARDVAGIGGLTAVADGQFGKLVDRVRQLAAEGGKLPRAFAGLSAQAFVGPTLAELGVPAGVDVLGTRNVGGDALRPAAPGQSVRDATEQEITGAVNAQRAAAAHAAALAEVGKRLRETGAISKEEYDKIVDDTGQAQTATLNWSDAVQGVVAQIQALGLSGTKLGGLLGSIGGGASAFKALGSQVTGGLGGLFKSGGLGSLFKDQGKLSASSLLGGISAGLGAAGAVVSIGSSLIKLFGGDPIKKAQKAIGQQMGVSISRELADSIRQQAKQLGLALKDAALLNLSSIMQEGIAAGKSAGSFSGQALELLSGAASGRLPATKALTEVGKAFTEISNEALKAGRIGDTAFTSIIRRARELGQEVPEIKAFVQEQLRGAAAGLGKVIASFTPEEQRKGGPSDTGFISGILANTEDDARSQATIFSVTFWATVKELGVVQAADALREPFQRLTENITTIVGDPTVADALLGPIRGLIDLTSEGGLFRGAVEGAQGLSQVLSGLANADIPLTITQFQAFEQQASAAYEQAKQAAIDAGLSTEEAQTQALLGIAPLLQSLVAGANAYGLELDQGAQALIDQAKASGVAFATSPVDRMATAVERLVGVLGKAFGLTEELGGSFGALGDRADGIGGGTRPTPGTVTESTADVPRLARGGIVPFKPGGTLAVIGEAGPEAVVPLGGSGPTRSAGAVSVSAPITVNVSVDATGQDPTTVAELVGRAIRDNVAQLQDRMLALVAQAA